MNLLENGQNPVPDGVKRTVGISVLRRLSRVAEEEAALEKTKSIWAKRLIGTFAAIAAALAVLALSQPEVLRHLFRGIAGLVR